MAKVKVVFAIDTHILEQLDRYARKLGTTKNQVINSIIKERFAIGLTVGRWNPSTQSWEANF